MVREQVCGFKSSPLLDDLGPDTTPVAYASVALVDGFEHPMLFDPLPHERGNNLFPVDRTGRWLHLDSELFALDFKSALLFCSAPGLVPRDLDLMGHLIAIYAVGAGISQHRSIKVRAFRVSRLWVDRGFPFWMGDKNRHVTIKSVNQHTNRTIAKDVMNGVAFNVLLSPRQHAPATN